MGKRRKLKATEVLSYRDERWWLIIPTSFGFKHFDLGRLRDRDEAEVHALKVLSS